MGGPLPRDMFGLVAVETSRLVRRGGTGRGDMAEGQNTPPGTVTYTRPSKLKVRSYKKK